MCRLDRVTGIKSPAAPATSIRTEKTDSRKKTKKKKKRIGKNYTIILGSAFLRYTAGLRHCDSTVNIIYNFIQGVHNNIASFVVAHILFLRISRNMVETVDRLGKDLLLAGQWLIIYVVLRSSLVRKKIGGSFIAGGKCIAWALLVVRQQNS